MTTILDIEFQSQGKYYARILWVTYGSSEALPLTRNHCLAIISLLFIDLGYKVTGILLFLRGRGSCLSIGGGCPLSSVDLLAPLSTI